MSDLREDSVDILMVNRNNGDFLWRTLASIATQRPVDGYKVPRIRLAFWDNASTDDSLTIVDEFQDTEWNGGLEVQVHAHGKNAGINDPLNGMIQDAQSRRVVVFDGDDVMPQHYLALMSAAMDAREGTQVFGNYAAGFAFANTRAVNEEGRLLRVLHAGRYDPWRLLGQSPFPGCAMIDTRYLKGLVDQMPLPNVPRHTKHPRYAGLAAMGVGGVYVSDPRVWIDYTQHAAQTSGARDEMRALVREGVEVDRTEQVWGVPQSVQLHRLSAQLARHLF